jgi:hypothetical protein
MPLGGSGGSCTSGSLQTITPDWTCRPTCVCSRPPTAREIRAILAHIRAARLRRRLIREPWGGSIISVRVICALFMRCRFGYTGT